MHIESHLHDCSRNTSFRRDSGELGEILEMLEKVSAYEKELAEFMQL